MPPAILSSGFGLLPGIHFTFTFKDVTVCMDPAQTGLVPTPALSPCSPRSRELLPTAQGGVCVSSWYCLLSSPSAFTPLSPQDVAEQKQKM